MVGIQLLNKLWYTNGIFPNPSQRCHVTAIPGGANVNHRDHGHRCTTPFIIAVQSKRTDLVPWLYTWI